MLNHFALSHPILVYAVLMIMSSNLEQGLQSSMGNIDCILESPQDL